MKKTLLGLFFLVTASAHIHACKVINVGNPDDNSDCSSVLNTIYRLKATVPSKSVDQKVYSTLWQDDTAIREPLNVLYLAHKIMVNADFYSACHETPTQECLKNAAEICLSIGSNCSIDWDDFKKYEEDGEWTSGYKGSWYNYTQHLKQYNNFLIGYWAKNLSFERNYFVVDVTKNNLEISISKL